VRAELTGNWISSVLRFRDLLVNLTWRDIRVRYTQSLLGIGWAVLLPLSLMLVFTFVFTRAIDARRVLQVDMPYALFAYSGLVPWTFFSASLSSCVVSLVANRNLVTKVYFPREVFPLSCIAGSFVDFCVAMTVLAALVGYFSVTTSWTFSLTPALAFLPVVVLVQIVLTIGLGMLLAIFLLGLFDPRANLPGILIGLGAGLFSLVGVWVFTDIPKWWFGAFTMVPTFVIGALASRAFAPPPPAALHDTLFRPSKR
jgi:ABC-type polysaccharide/polyol phosphate export permease